MTQSSTRPQLAHLTATLDELRAKGTYFKLRILDDQQAPVCHYDGRKVINLASNNYLGLANDPRLIEASLAATRKYGAGSGAVRTIAGTMKIHMELEEKIARFKNVEACVTFQSGFTANSGTVGCILGKEDFILSDELNHASIIDGARLSRAKIKVFRHKDAAHCEELLKELANEPGHKLIITDGVFSMDGDIGAVDKLAALAEKYGAIMMVDDAHASGVLGRNGRGSVDHFGLHGKVDVQVGTLSKAIGCLGGYVCGSRDLIDYLYHRARPFLFSTSCPPLALRPSTFWKRSRSASSGCGQTPATSRANSSARASTPAASLRRPARHRFRRSLLATGGRRWSSQRLSLMRA
jgi:glycine C-acetyltransferase